MKTFKQYAEEQDNLGDMGASGFSPDENLIRIAKMAIADHLDELVDFFTTLGQRDHRIRTELESYKKDKDGGMYKKQKHLPPAGTDDDTDEVVPSSSDGLGSEIET